MLPNISPSSNSKNANFTYIFIDIQYIVGIYMHTCTAEFNNYRECFYTILHINKREETHSLTVQPHECY